MTKKIVLLAALCAAATTQAAPWFQFGGSEYAVTSFGLWTDAEAEAISNGGNLVSIGSEAEEAFLTSTFGSDFLFWIGFTDEAMEGTWVWTDGSPVTYTNWAFGEPNDFDIGEDHAVMNWVGVQWNDWFSFEEAYGIMERPIDQPVPEVHHYASILGAAMIGANILRRRRSAK